MKSGFNALLLASALLASPAFAAADGTMALGNDGTVYQLLQGYHQEFFPTSMSLHDEPVMVLEVLAPGKDARRLLVPDTSGNEVENSPSVQYEASSDAVFIIWESRVNMIHSSIKMARHGVDGWSESINISGEFFSLKSSPRLTVTHDSYLERDADGEILTKERSIYHAVWWEEAAKGPQVIYSPVVLIDGEYTGINPVYTLNDLELGDGFPNAPIPTAELNGVPTIAPGDASHSVVVGFVDPARRSQVTLKLDVVLGEVALLAQDLGTSLVDLAAGLDPDDYATLADRARVYIIDIGARLRMAPGALFDLADETADFIATNANGSATPRLGEKARVYFIDIGARNAAAGLIQAREERESWLFTMDHQDGGQVAPKSPMHAIRAQLMANRPAPASGPRPTELMVSPSGANALVLWDMGGAFRYREALGNGDWSRVRVLPFSQTLSWDDAHRVLQSRVRNE